MTQGKRVILLARHDDGVVGTVQVVWENSGDGSGLYLPGAAVVHHLRTRPGCEGRGIGRGLLEVAEVLAMRRGLVQLTLGVEPDNERTMRLYRAMGTRHSTATGGSKAKRSSACGRCSLRQVALAVRGQVYQGDPGAPSRQRIPDGSWGNRGRANHLTG